MDPRNLLKIINRLSKEAKRSPRLFRFQSNSQPTVSKSLDMKTLEDIPGPNPLYNLPYIGIMLLSQSQGGLKNFEFHKFAAQMQKQYGDIVKLRIKRKWGIFVFHPDIAKEVLEKHTKLPVTSGVEVYKVYSEHKKLYPALGNLQGEDWAKLRKPTQEQMLRPAAVSEYVSILSEVADDFVRKHTNGGLIEDFKSEITNYVTECTGMLCFNKRLGCIEGASVLDNNHLNDIFEACDQDLKRLGPSFYKYVSTPLYRKFERAADQLFGVTNTEIQGAIDKLKDAEEEGRLEEYIQGPNLLYALLTHPKMSPEMVKSVLLDLFLAGVESTSNVLSFLWFELARNTDKQQKLHEEILSVCGNNGVTKESLTRMPYLKACVKEVMRLYPPTTPGVIRRLEEDSFIGGYQIPASTEIFVFLQHICGDPRFFNHPEEFLPERFLRDEDPKIGDIRNLYPYATLPFGFGTRSCIGQRFAETMMHTITAKFFRHLEISLPSGARGKLKSRYRLFLTPAQRVPIIIHPRL
ncbi:probable cytochrome P450 12d1 distal, mitochondrial [Saccostrea echinata]|uniref:probable cytochrome P450 12d1 distal, mitochondrial n=1 Tax=Saccostrea echinata TaxID=191078 RepID=UPI002A815882|nr:probable cytochrome P450 12d1 distal, mitochondrial [Saccostrea echinata]